MFRTLTKWEWVIKRASLVQIYMIRWRGRSKQEGMYFGNEVGLGVGVGVRCRIGTNVLALGRKEKRGRGYIIGITWELF